MLDRLRNRNRRRPVAALLAGFVCLVSLVAPRPAAGQVPLDRPSGVERASQALGHGRLDDAERLLRSLDARDPEVVTLRARLLRVRGRASEAETLLKPAVSGAPASGAALELGLLLVERGRRQDARAVLQPILAAAAEFTTAADYLRAARAAQALGEVETANDYFREAAATGPDTADLETAWGALFLEKHNREEASRSFEAALKADPQWAAAHVGLARVTAEDNVVAALASAARALTIDPTLVDAYLFMAELLLWQGQPVVARKQVEQALQVDPRSLPAHRLLAAMACLAGQQSEYEAELDRVRAVNPHDGEVYRITAEQMAREYRFEEAVKLARQAVAVDPENARAHADLGMHLLRTGDEMEARLTLDAALRLDPYDVVTYNLLQLLDTLGKFETVKSGKLVVRLDRDDAAVLGAYLVPLAEEALEKLSALYGVDPPGPILVEVFPHHDDFAVRTAGLPGLLGALGACFGRVVTMDSPRARQPGTFDWRPTLWHEMAHVVTLQLSNERVPRWLTEGISVFEEKRARPEWARRMEPELIEALERGAAPINIRNLTTAFANPGTVSLAYYTASLVVQHIVEKYGQPALRKVLAAYGDGLDTDAAFRAGLGVNLEKVQASFEQAIDAQFGPLRLAFRVPAGLAPASASLEELKAAATSEPASFPVQLALGRALRSAGDRSAAVVPLERAVALAPMVVGKDSARAVMADMALEQGDREKAATLLEEELGYDPANVELARRLAEIVQGLGDATRVRAVYERIAALDPFDSKAHAVIGRSALDRQDATSAVREFKLALASGPSDQAAAHCDLAEALLLAGDLAAAKREVLAALEVAPTYDRGQDLLLKLVDRGQARGGHGTGSR